MKIDLGCGNKKKEGFFGIDQYPGKDVDKICNLNIKLPFEDNSIEEIFSNHVLEHIDSLEKIMKEIYRICRPNALVCVKVPHFSGKSAFFEFHKRFFRYDSFLDFEQKKEDMFITKKVKIKMLKRKIFFLKRYYYPWNYLIEYLINSSNRLTIFYEETFLRNLFPAHEVEFQFKIIK